MPDMPRNKCPICHETNARYATKQMPDMTRNKCPICHETNARYDTKQMPDMPRNKCPICHETNARYAAKQMPDMPQIRPNNSMDGLLRGQFQGSIYHPYLDYLPQYLPHPRTSIICHGVFHLHAVSSSVAIQRRPTNKSAQDRHKFETERLEQKSWGCNSQHVPFERVPSWTDESRVIFLD